MHIYATPASDSVTAEELTEVLSTAYADKPFVRVRTDVLPATKYVEQHEFLRHRARSPKAGWSSSAPSTT